MSKVVFPKEEDPFLCILCKKLETGEVILRNDLAFAVQDAYPVTPGHTLVLPIRHVPDYFEMTDEEHRAVHEILRRRRIMLLEQDGFIRGFNIGVNCGDVSGQTIFHCHIHLIPRREGDTPDPSGGVRGVIPEKMHY